VAKKKAEGRVKGVVWRETQVTRIKKEKGQTSPCVWGRKGDPYEAKKGKACLQKMGGKRRVRADLSLSNPKDTRKIKVGGK